MIYLFLPGSRFLHGNLPIGTKSLMSDLISVCFIRTRRNRRWSAEQVQPTHIALSVLVRSDARVHRAEHLSERRLSHEFLVYRWGRCNVARLHPHTQSAPLAFCARTARLASAPRRVLVSRVQLRPCRLEQPEPCLCI